MTTRQKKDFERNRKVKEAEQSRKAVAESAVDTDDATAEVGQAKANGDGGKPDAGDKSDADGKDDAKKGHHGPFHRKDGKDASVKGDGKHVPQHMGKGKKNGKPKQHRVTKIVVAIIAVVAMVLASGMGIYGLFVGAENAANNSVQETGKVAAVVMGDNIMEDTITTQIMNTRGDKSDADWAQYLVDNDETPASLRSSIISSYQSDIILRHAMLDNGLSYTLQPSDVDRWWDAEGSTYEQYGIDEDTAKSYYASTIRQWLLEQAVAPEDSITDQDVLDYLNENADTYNGARKSSHILFALDKDGDTTNKDEAESVLLQIQNGEISFDDAVSKYSTDTSSASDGGNVGWDCDSSFVSEYETALKGLSKGEIASDIVQSKYGYHIIECTDVLEWDGTLDDISIVPADIVSSIREQLQLEKYQEWYDNYTASADITINDMPDGLPYDVSLDGVTKSENANDTSSSSGVSVVSMDENGNVVSSDDGNSGFSVSGTTTSDDGTLAAATDSDISASSDTEDASSDGTNEASDADGGTSSDETGDSGTEATNAE